MRGPLEKGVTRVKRVFIILTIAAVAILATAGTAFANFGPHGGYALDTDACAGCHRAHTSFSTLTWEDTASNDHSALLISSAQTMEEFCYACHGAGAPGAATNVEVGVFDSGPSGSAGTALGGGIMYQTASAMNQPLNGGAFTGVSAMHDMDKGSVTDPMWGAGNTAPAGTNLTCTGCHDVHGSTNYRILKDQVNGHTVGGYNGDTPQWYVSSFESGYPAGGWLKHTPGASQMTTYFPNYTSAEYKWNSTATYSGTKNRSMSTWCAACHESYNKRTGSYTGSGDSAVYNVNGTYNYNEFESNVNVTRTVAGSLTAPGGTQFIGARVRHRHPVDVVPATVTTANGWGSDAVTSTVLPLEKRLGAPTTERGTWTVQDYMGCLTCHRAHGSAAVMTGWANSRIVNHPSADVTWSVEPTIVAPAGVNPNVSAAILRADNRGVCERCHNK